jgi:hypothetical protein
MRVAVSFLLLLLPLLQSDVLLLPALLAADAADLLQLAINCDSSTAMSAFGRFPSQLGPTAARRLLLTAAVRHRADMAMSVAAQAAVQQHLDAATMSAALSLLLPRAASWHAGIAIAMLLDGRQVVVQQMEGAALVEVLHAAVRSREHIARYAQPLFKLPNAQQLGVPVVLELLRAAVGTGVDPMMLDGLSKKPNMVCSLPAAQQLPSGDVVRLLLAAVEARDTQMVCALLHLPAAQQLSDGDVMRVLRAAEQNADAAVLQMCNVLMS